MGVLGGSVCPYGGSREIPLYLWVPGGGGPLSWGGSYSCPPPPPPPRFSPDSLGLQASSALAWLLLEVLAVLLSLYLFSLPTDLSTPDLLAFAGYKYVG